MTEPIKFRLAMRSLEAGKPAPNEDNWFIDSNLSNNIGINSDEPIFETDRVEQLSDCGTLLMVADGMGGMNAGEVASEIARNTAGEFFAPGKITPEMASSHKSRCAYMEKTIIETNRRILADQKANTDHSGMGSTMIMAWLCGNQVSVTWIGDSRAYIWTKRDQKLHPISTDHSYVQTLVDDKKITYEQAFSHPQGNIVVRSLGDPSKDAEPQSANPVTVAQGDIILLCSDGLSGVLFDHKAYSDGDLISQYNIEDIITENQDQKMSVVVDKLFHYAQLSDWYDNVTVILCQIMETSASVVQPVRTAEDGAENPMNKTIMKITRKTIKTGALVILAVILLGVVAWFWLRPPASTEPKPDLFAMQIDSLKKVAAGDKYAGLFDTATITSAFGKLIAKSPKEKVDSLKITELFAVWDYKLRIADTLLKYDYPEQLKGSEESVGKMLASYTDTIKIGIEVEKFRELFLQTVQATFKRVLADNSIFNTEIDKSINELKLSDRFKDDTAAISATISQQIVQKKNDNGEQKRVHKTDNQVSKQVSKDSTVQEGGLTEVPDEEEQ